VGGLLMSMQNSLGERDFASCGKVMREQETLKQW